MSTTPQPDFRAIMPFIRLGMLLTVVAAGGFLWYGIGVADNPLDFDRQTLNLVFLFAFTVAAFVVMRVRRQLEGDLVMHKKNLLILLAWSVAEGVALLGVVLMLTGDASFFVAGLIVLLMTFGVLPIPATAEEER
ncbi:MAG: hypothetical protein AAF564_10380 [Bacteroidota bacterium]